MDCEVTDIRKFHLVYGLLIFLVTECVFAVEVTPVIEGPSLSIKIRGNNVTLDVDEIQLDLLIDEIARQAGFTIIRFVELSQTVSYKFNDTPLGIALKRLLRSRSHMIQFDSMGNVSADSTPTVKTLWILPQQGDAQSHIMKRTVRGLDKTIINGDIRFGITDHPINTSNRADNVAELGKFSDSYTLGELSLALTDPDSEVREAAIQSLAERGGKSAVRTLAVALADTDPEIREQAVYALGDIGGDAAIVLLQQSLGDSVDFVRDAAAEVLFDMDRD